MALARRLVAVVEPEEKANGLARYGTQNGRNVLREDEVKLIFRLANEQTLTQREIADLFKCSQSNVRDIKFKHTWGHLWIEGGK
jgi:hypothetical protein